MSLIEPSPGFTRRQLIERLGGGLGLAGLLPLLGDSPASAAQLQFRPRAKRVIQLFMNGGPFQADFFDPKPLLAKYEGQRPEEVVLRTERVTAGLLASPFAYSKHGSSGLPISELLPNLAKFADDLCVLRSLHTDNPNHGPALYQMNNGTITPRRPSMGSWFLYGLGSENQNLPGYVVLCPGRPVRFAELWTSAFLPAQFQGTYINHSNLAPAAMIPFLKNGSMTTTSQRQQLDLLQSLNREHLAERGADDQLDARINSLETAFRMQTEAADAFDISHEPKAIRAEYGEGKFADACLLARRLAERGVRFTQIYYGNGQPWDTHSKHHEQVRTLAKAIDQPIAALLADLKRTGLLEDTLVVWGGEFGRTPTSENGDGRDHNHYGFTMCLAGGGVRGGMTYGETDDFGFRAVQNKVHIHDLHATILYLLGINHEKLTYRYSGRDFRLTDVHGRILQEIVT
ncbi:hypothetical protein ETAA8_48700 [Anatilimnocola aggregata]|uniref:DUF1501 domain-containing protein n=1 Tax=Anatilimnocola aggregata TaxID=2528021 RepID=A0A517YHS3_9BACT|nr:DUF1501 domain-containing protein [Anatilimnocola aggregata]QDU29755.1 hypothetical protein ETAA8_48700 [Anatilimnocola aggregata]